MNNKGDKGSPWRSHLELEKKLEASPLIKTENQTMEMQKKIHLLYLLGKPIFSRIAISNSQEMWS